MKPENLPLMIFNDLMSLANRLNRDCPTIMGDSFEYPKKLISSFSDSIIKHLEIDSQSIYRDIADGIDMSIGYSIIMSEHNIHLLDNLLNYTIIPNLVKYYDMPSAIVYPDSLLEKDARDYLMDCYTGESYINPSTTVDAPIIYIPSQRLIAFRYYIKINKISDQDMKNAAIDVVKKAIVRNSLMYIFQNMSITILDILKEKEK